MIINRKVCHGRMKNKISRVITGTKVVREQSRRGLHWDKKFRQQSLHPLQFGRSNGNGTILSLSGRLSNSTLLCRTPGDGVSTKEYEKSTCGGTIIWVTSPIRIQENVQCLRSVCKKPDTKGSHSITIMKLTFNRSLMVFERCMHKLGEFVHGKGNICLSHPKMLEATNHLTVHGGIDWCNTIISSQGSTVSASVVETGLEPSMLCLLRRSMTYFC